jgi:vancomycin resistance protein VanJ
MKKKVAAKTSKATEDNSTPRRGWLRMLLRGLWTAGAFLATLLFFVGLPMRLLRDDYESLALLFYATPWAVLMICGFVSAWFWRRYHRFALGLAVVSLLCVGGWIWNEVRFAPDGRGPASFRVAYWNCGHPEWRLRGILPMAESWHADLLAFGESRDGALSDRWAVTFPKLHLQSLSAEMLFAGPENAELKSSGSLGGGGTYHFFHTQLAKHEVFVLLVDFNAVPTKSRSPAFDRLLQLVNAYKTQPLIVMGDFNTPGDSIYFKNLRQRTGLIDAFDNAGSGIAGTWPMLAPVLSLDHILVNSHLRVVRCEHHTSLYSDHRAVVADLAWPGP